MNLSEYSKTCLNQPFKNRQNKGLKDKRTLNEGQKYCRMLKHSAILLTCIKRIIQILGLENQFLFFLSGYLRQVLQYSIKMLIWCPISASW